ncbi:aminopeptidase C [Olsenella sp. HMSC062G07]|uniref:aminopeptidase C n=1 Tax=Olsenella sp. HMSC062G07 TaxID=1739330 RepID=UPI0008A18AD0|nr:C1 family peptidase [Olsenella sp. HMSC062G07]OFK24883.1 peptidase C1 [Olsenella sp. HMSC062G07]
MAEGSVRTDWAARQGEAFSAERANRVARNAVTSMNVMAAARDVTKMRSYHDSFAVSIRRTGEVTYQRQSGRCWLFAAYNVARQATMRLLDVKSVEFSQAFGMFYDKLEKANATLERVIETVNLPDDAREVQQLMDEGMDDGGYMQFALSLIEKWGIVPKDAMPETACSKDSSQMNAQLGRLVHKAASEMRAQGAQLGDSAALRATKACYMEEVYRLLCVCLGEPPAHVDLTLAVGPACKADPAKIAVVKPDDDRAQDGEEEGSDKPRRILRDPHITPREFAERYVPLDPRGFVSLVSIPSERFPFGKVYRVRRCDSVIGGIKTRFLNVAPEVLDHAAASSLQKGRPVWMACDVMQQFPRHIEDYRHVLSPDAVDVSGLFGVDLSMDRSSMVDIGETRLTHAMCLQGVELDAAGDPVAWRVENSWGKDAGKDGYLVMDAAWFHLYGGEVDVTRDLIDDELLGIWDDESRDVEVEPWSGMGRALGVGARA